MIQKKNIAGLDIGLLTNISVERIEKTVKDFKTHRSALYLDSLLLRIIVWRRKQPGRRWC